MTRKRMLLTDLDVSLDESCVGLLACETLPSAVKRLRSVPTLSRFLCLEHGTSTICTLKGASSRPIDLGSMHAATSSLQSVVNALSAALPQKVEHKDMKG